MKIFFVQFWIFTGRNDDEAEIPILWPPDANNWLIGLILHFCLHCMRVQFSSVTQSCLTLCDPMDCSTPGFPVHHQLLEFTQTHVHRVGDAIQPSHPLSSTAPPTFSLSQIRVFSNESALCIRWPKYWSFSFRISPSNEHSEWISLRMDWLDLLAVQGTQESSPTPQFKSVNSSALSFL